MKKNILTSEGMMKEIIIICTVSQGLLMKGSIQVYKTFFMMGSVPLSWQYIEWNHFRRFSQQLMKVVASLIKGRNLFSRHQPQVCDLSIELNIKKFIAWAWVVHACNPFIWEAAVGRWWVLGWPWLHSESSSSPEIGTTYPLPWCSFFFTR